jgi:hypothetical protein
MVMKQEQGGITFGDGVLEDGKLVIKNERILSHDTIGACPHVIFAQEHYREDGSCKCNDVNDPNMAEWGYVWNGISWE